MNGDDPAGSGDGTGRVRAGRVGDDDGSGDDAANGDATGIAPTRVRRSRSAPASWYGPLGRWCDRVAGPFEAPAREAGLSLLDARPGERGVDGGSGPGRALVALGRSAGPGGASSASTSRRACLGRPATSWGPCPLEKDRFLLAAESGLRFDLDEFVDRVAATTGEEGPDALYRAQQVVGLLDEVVPAGEVPQVRDQLPTDYDPLVELTELATR